MTSETSGSLYRERLLPGVGLFVALLLLIPAVALVMMPINRQASLPAGIIAFVVMSVLFIMLSPVVEVRDGKLIAGRAEIPVTYIGNIQALGSEALREEIGVKADARNYMLVRGWIHRGLRLEITDESDPTPAWIITSRKPLSLAQALGATVTHS